MMHDVDLLRGYARRPRTRSPIPQYTERVCIANRSLRVITAAT